MNRKQILKAVQGSEQSTNPYENRYHVTTDVKVVASGKLVVARRASSAEKGYTYQDEGELEQVRDYLDLLFVDGKGNVVDVSNTCADDHLRCSKCKGTQNEFALVDGKILCEDCVCDENGEYRKGVKEAEERDKKAVYSIAEVLRAGRKALREAEQAKKAAAEEGF